MSYLFIYNQNRSNVIYFALPRNIPESTLIPKTWVKTWKYKNTSYKITSNIFSKLKKKNEYNFVKIKITKSQKKMKFRYK